MSGIISPMARETYAKMMDGQNEPITAQLVREGANLHPHHQRRMADIDAGIRAAAAPLLNGLEVAASLMDHVEMPMSAKGCRLMVQTSRERMGL